MGWGRSPNLVAVIREADIINDCDCSAEREEGSEPIGQRSDRAAIDDGGQGHKLLEGRQAPCNQRTHATNTQKSHRQTRRQRPYRRKEEGTTYTTQTVQVVVRYEQTNSRNTAVGKQAGS